MQIAPQAPTGTFASDRLAPLLAAVARTPGLADIRVTRTSPTFGELARAQEVFDIASGSSPATVRPLTQGACDALAGPRGDVIHARILGTHTKLSSEFGRSNALNSVALAVGSRPVRFQWGRSVSTREPELASTHVAEGHALLVAASQLAAQVPDDELSELRSSTTTIPAEWQQQFENDVRALVESDGSSSSRVEGGGAQLILGGWDGALFRTPADPSAPYAHRDAGNIVGLVSHEAMHAVAPWNPDENTWRRLQWLEEGGANTLGEWAGQFSDWATALGVPDPSPARPQTDHEYYPMQVAVGRLLALAGFDERRAEDFRGGSTLLQCGPIEQAPERIANAIAARYALDDASRSAIAELIANSRADATVIDRVEAIALDQASRSTSSV